MLKCQLYHEGMNRLLHKLTGMEVLNEEYEDVCARHDRYKGYHVFPNKSAAEYRSLKGELAMDYFTSNMFSLMNMTNLT